MSVGSLVRNIAGPFERSLCAAYRSIFINIQRCTREIASGIPAGTHVVDVGGGDGEPLNVLLGLRPDIRVSMLDLRDRIGMFLAPEFLDRVSMHPATSLSAYRTLMPEPVDVVLVSDVVHHVPTAGRLQFVRDCVSLLAPGGVLIIKDVAPGGWVSRLSVLADRYITGDRHVSLMAPADLVDLVESQGMTRMSHLLPPREYPNYAVSFRRDAATAS